MQESAYALFAKAVSAHIKYEKAVELAGSDSPLAEKAGDEAYDAYQAFESELWNNIRANLGRFFN